MGWDSTNARDFYPSAEQHELHIAEKWHGDGLAFGVRGTPSPARPLGPSLRPGEYEVVLTLRANNFRKPERRTYCLTVGGVKGRLELENS